MFKTIAVVLGLSPLLACMPMDDHMADDTMMEDSATMHTDDAMDGDTMMDDGDSMS